jgi:MFS transporter, DHA2 family, multidrug resistance protein
MRRLSEGEPEDASGGLTSLPDYPGLPMPRRALAVAVLLLMIAVLIGGAGAVSIGLPQISSDLGISPATTIWIQSAYQVMVVVAILPCSTLSERIGQRRVFRLGLAAMAFGAGLAMLFPQIIPLILARLFQGLGAAMVMSVSPGLLRDIYPSSRLGLAISINAVAVAVSAALGPLVGSLVLEVAPWPTLFGLFLPVGLIALAFSQVLPRDEVIQRPFDRVGALLNGLSAGGIMTALSVAGHSPGLAAAVLALSCVTMVVLIKHVRSVTVPFLPLDLLLDRRLAPAYGASTLNFAVNSMNVIALPFLLIHGLEMPTVTAGAVIACWSVAVAGSVVLVGWLTDRLRTEPLCLAGSTAVTAGLIGVIAASATGWVGLAVTGIVVTGLGFGCFQAANNRILISAAPHHRRAMAGGLQAMVREAGNGLGVGLTSLCFALAGANGAYATLTLGLCMAAAATLLNGARIGYSGLPPRN